MKIELENIVPVINDPHDQALIQRYPDGTNHIEDKQPSDSGGNYIHTSHQQIDDYDPLRQHFPHL